MAKKDGAGSNVVWNDEQFDVLVCGDEDSEPFAKEFSIGLHQEYEG